jgi:hypothetical protein
MGLVLDIALLLETLREANYNTIIHLICTPSVNSERPDYPLVFEGGDREYLMLSY